MYPTPIVSLQGQVMDNIHPYMQMNTPPFLHPAVLLVLRLRRNGFLRIVGRIMRVLMLIGKYSLLC